MRKKKTSLISISITSQSAQELLGRQSVRTTFKLSERSIDALSILAAQLGIKQKSLFDHLIDDVSALGLLAEESHRFVPPKQRVAKTFVISRRTLQNLEKVSTRYQTPRDALVELSVERILPLIEEEKKKHEHRKEILQKMAKIVESGNELFEMAVDTLDVDDPVFRRLQQMMRTVHGCYADIENCVDKGRKIEDF